MKQFVMAVTVASILTAGAVAQTSEVGQRAKNQQERVAQGVKSGQMTAGETSNVETKEAAINQEVKADRTANGGKLTTQEKATVNQQQNAESKQINQDKHNAATQKYGNNKVGARRENQQDRIASGVASGKMSAGQAAKVENGEAGINKEVHADRSANGGKLTPTEKKQVNSQQNKASKQIYKDKHS